MKNSLLLTLYRIARNAYQRVFNRRYWRHRQQQKDLFRRFVTPGSLVFDIGANQGEVSAAFMELGARVVAVEPNPVLCDRIRHRYGRSVSVENAAAGAAPGRAELFLGRHSGHSTLSQEWLTRAPTPDRWEGTISTEVTTLDDLIEKYGAPDFVKIDVEAYEDEVLSGLHRPVPALCFEYQASYPEVAEHCLVLLGESYEYALTAGADPALTTAWIDSTGALEEVKRSEPDAYGDIFARHIDSH